jgi:hypothetical protein
VSNRISCPDKKKTKQMICTPENIAGSCISAVPNSFSTEASSSPGNVRLNTKMNFSSGLRELSDHAKALSLQFRNEFQGLLLKNTNVIHQLIKSDETKFHFCGVVNKLNFCYWSEMNLQQMHETPLHSPKVRTWCRIASFDVYGSHFFKDELVQL